MILFLIGHTAELCHIHIISIFWKLKKTYQYFYHNFGTSGAMPVSDNQKRE